MLRGRAPTQRGAAEPTGLIDTPEKSRPGQRRIRGNQAIERKFGHHTQHRVDLRPGEIGGDFQQHGHTARAGAVTAVTKAANCEGD